jgi:hypothetical protein
MVLSFDTVVVLCFGALLATLAAVLLLGIWRAAGRPAYLAA